MVGAGPYMLTEWVENSSMTYRYDVAEGWGQFPTAGGGDGFRRSPAIRRIGCLTAVAEWAMVTALGSRPMRKMHDDTYPRSHWWPPRNRRPRRRPAGPRSGWPIPPIRSDLVGEADKLLPSKRPVIRLSTPQLFISRRSLTARAGRPAGAFGFSTGGSGRLRVRRLSPRSFTDQRNRPGSPGPQLTVATQRRQVSGWPPCGLWPRKKQKGGARWYSSNHATRAA